MSDLSRTKTTFHDIRFGMTDKNALISVIINNYNFSRYITDAVSSVLAQTYDNFELIIVDDGSTDNSREIISALASGNEKIKTVYKPNEGQASALNAGYKASQGGIICFLDSDDYFSPEKLAEIHKMHANGHPYIYTDHQGVDSEKKATDDPLKRYKYDGFNSFLVYYMSKYPGNVTSTLSLTRDLAERIFPIEYPADWVIQADDCIVFQAGMLSKATYLDKKLSCYRMHNSNGYFGRKLGSDYIYELLIKRNALKKTALEKMHITDAYFRNTYNLISEFKTHRRVDAELLRLYLRTLWVEMDIGLINKIKTSLVLFRLYQHRGSIQQ